MKITKEQLNQMIQEELDAYLSETDEDMDLTFEGEEEEEKMGDMEDMPAEAEGEGDNEELMASLRNLYDVLQGMFGGEGAPEDEVAEAKDEDEMNEAKKAEDKEDLNESVTINRFKQLANIRG
jgi:hypothetical protein